MAQDEQGYNGWMNFETWCVALWIDNEPYWYNESRAYAEQLAEELEEGIHDDKHDVITLLEERIEEDVTEHYAPAQDAVKGLYADLLNASLKACDYREIARSILSEFLPEEDK